MTQNTHFSSHSDVTAIIVAAGSGTRFGDDLPKQYHHLNGEPVLRHTLKAFANHPHISDIIVVIAPGFEDLYDNAAQGIAKLKPPVIGGATRQQSVYNALSSLHSAHPQRLILIHDAARPCIDAHSIDRIIASLQTHKAASLAIPVTDTLRKGDQDHLSETVSRDNLYAMQTPQGFHFETIMAAHETFKSNEFTDDTSLVSERGTPVAIVAGSRQNIKITTQEDMMITEKYLTPRMLIPRTGLGFDVHAFGEEAANIRIGGVDIPHTHKLKGHSDADVLLHAITDALYGVIADGDIGSHFPPSNMAYKDKDSAFFLEDAVNAVRQKHGRIVHVDSVIMCEAPKIGPHRDAIRERVARIIGIAPSKVSVKATTTEELGFTGRREGIAAQAIVTVLFPDEDET